MRATRSQSALERLRPLCLGRARRITVLAAILCTSANLGGLALGSAPASASSGECANEQLRIEDDSTALPDCRADELVEPPYTAGSNSGGTPTVASGGERIITINVGAFAGVTGGQNEYNAYEYTLTSQGWIATALEPPNSVFPSTSFFGVDKQFFEGANSTLTTTLWQLRRQSAAAAVLSYYLREPRPESGCPAGATEVEAPREDACIVEVGPETSTANTEGSAPTGEVAGTSEDLSKVLFNVRAPTSSGTDSQDYLWPGDTTKSASTLELKYSLYEYEGTGKTEPLLVGVKNQHALASDTEAELISSCGTELGSGPGTTLTASTEGDKYNAVSADGETVFFTALSGKACTTPHVNELYARLGGAHTLALSEPSLAVYGRECTGTCETDETTEADRKAATFQGASENGSKVFFLTEQPLVNGAVTTTQKKDLYEEEIEGGEVTSLVQVSHDPHAGQAAEVEGVARASEDGSHVYFVAKGELASNENGNHEKATEGKDNLYVYERDAAHLGGRLRFIAMLSSSDSADWKAADERPVQTTPNGEYLAFVSVAHLTPDDTTSTTKQVYEYDAETGELTRASVGQCPAGAATCETDERYGDDGLAGTAVIPEPEFQIKDKATEPQSKLAISDDGADVFFTSTDVLAAGAVNGVENVYEYERSEDQNGNVELIEGGASEEIAGVAVQRPATLKAISGSAEDAFFTTARSLVGQDTNTARDLYDARIGGGFAAPASPPPGCEPATCQGSLGAVLGQPAPSGSATQTPGENAISEPRETVGEVKITKHSIHGQTITLTVEAPAKGKLTLSGPGLRKLTKPVKAAGTYQLKTRPTAAEVLAIKRKGKVRLKVRVTFKPASGKSTSAAVKVTLRS